MIICASNSVSSETRGSNPSSHLFVLRARVHYEERKQALNRSSDLP
jgi:hypothetical protein